MVSDHPRSRGVYRAPASPARSAVGSSPLARGLREQVSGDVVQGRIIPARAGFTRSWAVTMGVPRDHPRSRGVYFDEGDLNGALRGSSPLARGLRSPLSSWGTIRGIIPARAGFTRRRRRTPATHSDHPRSRGVYIYLDATAADEAGSSPLARGLRIVGLVGRPHGRIIPARAGFTFCRLRRRAAVTDHPRSRGVYSRRVLHHVRDSGIIPARAGFTGVSRYSKTPWSDHPRSRGVYPGTRREAGVRPGSSPLARGLRRIEVSSRRGSGIIPARAGFTGAKSGCSSDSPDHPRSRGVYPAGIVGKTVRWGSSPLARGLRARPHPPRRPRRIIPARAGFTRC